MVQITEQANKYLELFREGKSGKEIAEELKVKYCSVDARFTKFRNLGLVTGKLGFRYTVLPVEVEVKPVYSRKERTKKQHEHVVKYKIKQEMRKQIYEPSQPQNYIAQIPYYRYGVGEPPQTNNFRLT